MSNDLKCKLFWLIDGRAAEEGWYDTNNEIMNAEVKSVPVTKKWLHFEFRDQEACMSLPAITVSRIYQLLGKKITYGVKDVASISERLGVQQWWENDTVIDFIKLWSLTIW